MVEKYVHKGSKLYLEGKIRSRSYVDRENQTRFVTEIVVDVLEILSRREPNNVSQAAPNSQNAKYTNPYDAIGEPQALDKIDIDDDYDFNAPF